MKIKFTVPGRKRKELATKTAAWLGVELDYLGAPTFAYKLGNFTIDLDGRMSCDENVDPEMMERLMQYLYDEGFNGETEEPNEVTVIAIQVPTPDEKAVENLKAIVKTKGDLFKKAFSCDSLEIKENDDMLEFPWFDTNANSDEVHAYMTFITKLCEMAKTQKRVNLTENKVNNEKYAFRCFLLRLGFIGDEYKADRKILLQNLEGSSAFKNGRDKEGSL